MENIKNWLTRNAIAIVIIVLLLCSNIYFKNIVIKERENVEILTKKVEFYTLKGGTLVATTQKIAVSEVKLKEIVGKSSKKTQILAKKFKKIDKISTTEQEICIDTIKVALNDSLQGVKIGKKIDPNFSFSYKITDKALEITDFKLKDTITEIGGVKRSWLFGKETETVDKIHSNKLFVTTNSTEVSIKSPKKWYESKVLWFTIGALTVISLK